MLVAAGTASPFLTDLAITLGVAAGTSVIFRRLGQPTTLGYLLAGLLVGPYVALPLFADPARTAALSEFGVVLVMFGIGLHFSPRDLSAAVPRAGLIGLAQVSAMAWIGFLLGRAFGWEVIESVFLGACLAISSTMVVAKATGEHPLSRAATDLVYGVLVIQDLVAIVMVAALTAVASGAGLGASELLVTTAKLLAFLVGLVVFGMLVVPRALRFVDGLGHPETLVVAATGLCFVMAVIAATAGYSVALGAFVAGSLAASSGLTARIEPMVTPLRDVFAAIFFVSVGMLVDPVAVLVVWPHVLVVALTVVVGQLAFVSLAAFLMGHGLRRSLQAGLALGQVGEFSFILAQVGTAAGVVDATFMPIVVVAATITATTTPIAVRHADAIAAWIDRKLPHRVHTVAALYESWIESLRAARAARRIVGLRRFVRLAIIDAVALVGVVAGGAIARSDVVDLAGRLGIAPWAADVGVGVATAAFAVPFVVGMIRCGRAVGATLARAALPQSASGTDLAFAPRRVLVVTLQLGVLCALGLPILAVTQPMLPAWGGLPVLLAAGGVLVVSLWRRADDLDEHVRAGAQAVVELLRRTSGEPTRFEAEHLERVLPGLGEISSLALVAGDAACGRTLAQLDLRGRTGATVIAIDRQGSGPIEPSGAVELVAGDVLGIVGTIEAIAHARGLLRGVQDEVASPDA
jgi:CPA2 family monovalent cation:H+ antiporter-2